MRQIFTKAQLVVLWVSGIAISIILIIYSRKPYLVRGYPTGKYYTDWVQMWIFPALIITGLLLVTFMPREPKQYKAQNLQKEQRRRAKELAKEQIKADKETERLREVFRKRQNKDMK